MDITFKEERFTDFYQELAPMFQTHWEELAIHKDQRPLDMDLPRYQQLNETGYLRILVARDGTKAVGYASFCITPNLHYKDWICASCDVYYLSPDYRKSGVGTEFFKQIKQWLSSYNVKSVVIATKKDHPHTKFFERLGFEEIEQNYELLI